VHSHPEEFNRRHRKMMEKQSVEERPHYPPLPPDDYLRYSYHNPPPQPYYEPEIESRRMR
jgi:hypothetical protein